VGGLFTRRRSYFILWTGWLVSMALVFSDVFILHSYYTAALSPPIAAILGAGIAGLWAHWTEPGPRSLGLAAAVALIVAGTVAYGIWLIRSSGAAPPAWLWRLAAGTGFVAVALLLVSVVAVSRRRVLAAALVACLAAVLVIPATASALLVYQQRGIGDTPFEAASTAAQNHVLLASSGGLGGVLPTLEKLQGGSPYVMAVYTAAVAAGFISASGKEILPIGGFTGTIPEPTLAQLQEMIRSGKFHLALLIGGHDPRLKWIASHCQHLGPGGGTSGLFICSPNDAPSGQT
jgi:4-amino-4-deoxy-L-arabinose transferase-like glycosyltransferase